MGSAANTADQRSQSLVALDVEGVLTPEVWIAVAEHTGIPSLCRTTRDEPDYKSLMEGRLATLDRHGVTMTTIMEAVTSLSPLVGAKEFLDELRSITQVVLLSDTFEQFGRPLMAKLGWPVLLCHSLSVDNDRIVGYHLRLPDQKARAIEAFRSLNYRVTAAGDSYNDVSMLAAAHTGVLFRAPGNVIAEYPQYPCYTDYNDLLTQLTTVCN